MTKAFAAFWLYLIGPACLLAHEPQTHQRIGDAAVAYLQQSQQYQSRPLLLGLKPLLEDGAVQEDLDPLPGLPFPVGRYFFHFHPSLNFFQPTLVASGSCPSDAWGLNDNPLCTATCIVPLICSVVSGAATNNNRWNLDRTADTTGAPNQSSITGFGYVTHLLEDLGSPAHTRNDFHPCPVSQLSFLYCDPFERYNDAFIGGSVLYGTRGTPNAGVALALPTGASAMIPTGTFTTPQEFFTSLQTYINDNYYSSNSVFQGGPCPITGCVGAGNQSLEDPQYLYAPCLTNQSGLFNLSATAGTCKAVVFGPTIQDVRKVAFKGFRYWSFCVPIMLSNGLNEAACDKTKAEVDQTIAIEQFAEIGPVLAQHVAAFIQFYAPELTVQVQGSGSGTVQSTNLLFPDGTSNSGAIDCANAACSAALLVQGTVVSLTAAHSTGSTFAGWGGACASAGTNTTAQLTLISDVACTATFNVAPAGCAVQTICGTVTDNETGTIPLQGIVIELRSSTGAFLQQTTTNSSGKYSFGSLTASNYFVDPVVQAGEFSSPSQIFAAPGTVANFKIGGVPASVTVSGPGSFTLAVFTLQPIPPGPPPCQGSGCPVSISGILPFSNPFSVSNGTWWLTCYVNDSVSQKTSNQQFVFTPQETISISCPQ